MTPTQVLALIREKEVRAVDLRFMDFPDATSAAGSGATTRAASEFARDANDYAVRMREAGLTGIDRRQRSIDNSKSDRRKPHDQSCV